MEKNLKAKKKKVIQKKTQNRKYKKGTAKAGPFLCAKIISYKVFNSIKLYSLY